MKAMLKTAFCLAALPALGHAAIIFEPSNDPTWVDENILFRDNTSGPVVTGVTNQTSTLLDFSGAGIDLTGSQAEGQAMVSGADGMTFSTLTIAPDDPSVRFSGLILDARVAHSSGAGTITFNVMSAMDSGGVASQSFDIGNGENYFTIHSDNPADAIIGVSIQTSIPLDDVRHVRIGGITTVPEPDTIAGFAIAALGFLAARRRRN